MRSENTKNMWGVRLSSCFKKILLINLLVIAIAILVIIKQLITEFNNNVSANYKSDDFVSEDLKSEDLSRVSVDNERMRRFSLNVARVEKSENDDIKDAIKNNNEIPKTTLILSDFKRFNRVVFKPGDGLKRNLEHRLVHVDLKGAPPRPGFLRGLMGRVKAAGATGLLLEYEDMFPFEGELKSARADNAYTRHELIEILQEARGLELEIVPLVQTFGHLEFILKLHEFRPLREQDAHADSICPSSSRALALIKDMILQVVELHAAVRELRWLHVGGDEVYHINQCDVCLKRNLSSKQLYLEHMVSVASYVRQIRPELTPLLWDDMLRGLSPKEIQESSLPMLGTPAVWAYSNAITRLVPQKVWYSYAQAFPAVWIASAFKGASGETRLIPDLKKNYENHLSWLEFIRDYKIPGSAKKMHFQGIILTGWSRYQHFAVLCEVLPVSIPSLILNLILVEGFMVNSERSSSRRTQLDLDREVFQIWLRNMKCPNRKEFRLQIMKDHSYLTDVEEDLHLCDFKGDRLYDDIKNLILIEKRVIEYHVVNAYKVNGFLEYNLKHDSLIVSHVFGAVRRAQRLESDVGLLSQYLQRHLHEFFDNSTVLEFVEYKIMPLRNIVRRVIDASTKAQSIREWSRRPFEAIADGG